MKKKTYRNKLERMEHAASLKRGGCIELFRAVSDCSHADLGFSGDHGKACAAVHNEMSVADLCEALGVKELYFKAAGTEEAMRDISDVEAVMTEKNLVGHCIAYRRVGERTRGMQQVVGFVTPKQEIGETGEEKAPEA